LRDLDTRLDKILSGLGAEGRLRGLKSLEPSGPARMTIGNRRVLNFSGNDYLGLSRHPALKRKAMRWTETFGAGSGASRLVTGNLGIFDRVERKVAALKGTEDALILASGFQANVSLLPALIAGGLFSGEPLVFCDRLNHASMHQGLRAAGARQIRFRHNDLDHLEELLKARANRKGPRFIVTESVFGMDGDRADVAAVSAIAERHDAFLYLDEAHATGVLGPGGAGLGLEATPGADLVMGTFSKALGGFGAYAACSAKLKSYLVTKTSGFVYRTRFEKAGLETGASSTQIVPVIVGGETETLTLAKALEEDGILAIAIRPPTVPKGKSRIRLAFSSDHSQADVKRLCDRLIHRAREKP